MSETVEVRVPNMGDFKDVEIIEVLVGPGDRIGVEDSLITLESEKASMDVPSTKAGKVKNVSVKAGDRVSEGDLILYLEDAAEEQESANEGPPPAPSGIDAQRAEPPEARPAKTAREMAKANGDAGTVDGRPPRKPPAMEFERAPVRVGHPPAAREAETVRAQTEPAAGPRPSPTAGLEREEELPPPHASPSVRRLARELGLDLHDVTGTGPRGRVLEGDVKSRVRRRFAEEKDVQDRVPSKPTEAIEDIVEQPLSRINKLTAQQVAHSWTTIPHVTQHHEADITDLEDLRQRLSRKHDAEGVKISLLPFVMKATVSALKRFPRLNSSLDTQKDRLLLKRFFNIGVAVDTPDGLVVPVIRDVDRKGVKELARELSEIAERARARKLKAEDVQGGSFTISNLGGIGGQHFTPIINQPEVAILGVSRASHRPIWKNETFVPRLMLPLSLSYDHRVVDGALGARFLMEVVALLSDFEQMLL